MGLEAIIFDVDGTLAATGEAQRSAFNQAFRDTGLNWRWPRMIYHKLDAAPTPLAKFEAYETDVAQFQTDEIKDAVLRRQAAHFRRFLESGAAPLRPGVARLIRDARTSGVKLGIASLSRRSDFEMLIINHLGVPALDWFECITTIEDLPAGANAEGAYRRTLRALDCNPAKSFAIEDSPSGSAAALRTGLRVIATPTLFGPGERFEGADLVLTDLGHPAAPYHVVEGDPGAFNYVSVSSLAARLPGAVLAA